MDTFKVLVIAWSFASMPALADIITFECDYPTYSDKTGVQESTGFGFTFV